MRYAIFMFFALVFFMVLFIRSHYLQYKEYKKLYEDYVNLQKDYIILKAQSQECLQFQEMLDSLLNSPLPKK